MKQQEDGPEGEVAPTLPKRARAWRSRAGRESLLGQPDRWGRRAGEDQGSRYRGGLSALACGWGGLRVIHARRTGDGQVDVEDPVQLMLSVDPAPRKGAKNASRRLGRKLLVLCQLTRCEKVADHGQGDGGRGPPPKSCRPWEEDHDRPCSGRARRWR